MLPDQSQPLTTALRCNNGGVSPLAMDQFLIKQSTGSSLTSQITFGAQKRRTLQKVDKTLRAGIDDSGIWSTFSLDVVASKDLLAVTSDFENNSENVAERSLWLYTASAHSRMTVMIVPSTGSK